MLKKGFWKKPGKWLIPLLGIGVFHSCLIEEEVSYQGNLSLEVVSDTVLVQNQTRASSLLELEDFANTADYAVEILQGTTSVQKYDRYDKLPDEVSLKPGDYTIQVSKGKNEPAAYTSPYFSGKQNFTIIEGMTTPVTVTAKMANARVTVDLTDDFLETYPTYTLSFMTNKMKTPLEYEAGSPMYFQADSTGTKLTIAMELVNVYGKEVQYTATTTIKPKQWSALTVRTDEKGLNGLALDVTLNDGTKETVYVNIGIPDFMEKLKGAPWITTADGVFEWPDSNKDTTINVEGTINLDAINPTSVDITAGGKINNLYVSVYEGNNKAISYDLANLNADQTAELKDKYGMDIISADIKGAASTSFNLEGLLSSLFGTIEKTYTIEVSVVDALPTPNTTTKKAVLNYAAISAPTIGDITITPSSFEEGAYTGEDVTVTISNVYSALKALYLDDTDLLSPNIPNIKVEPSEGKYTLTISKDWFNALSVGEHTYTIKAIDSFDREVEKSFSVTVTEPVFEWAMADNDGDVFAKYAFLKVKASNANKVTFYQDGAQIPSTDLVSLGRDESGVVTYVWKNLSPNTSYSDITAKYNGEYGLSAISFTTEEEVLLENLGKFENWTQQNVWLEDGWETIVPVTGYQTYTYINNDGWGTNNDVTAAKYSGTYSALYKSYPAVSPILKNGEYAASITSVGYGSGSKYYNTGGVNVDNRTAGRLYISKSLNSRPRKISFVSEFDNSISNSEQWQIKIELKAGNETIASVKKAFSSAVNEPIELEYMNETTKPDLIYIEFISSTADSPALKGITGSISGWKGYVDSKYIGNTLIIDDVELIYDYE